MFTAHGTEIEQRSIVNGGGDDTLARDPELARIVQAYIARIVARATACVGQRPLLASDLPLGVTLGVARRSARYLSHFFEDSRPLLELGGDCESSAIKTCGVCLLVVSEVCLVHYTKKPKRKKADAAPGDAPGLPGDHQQAPGVSPHASAAAPVVDDKYWKRRYNFFAKFDEGIRMDAEAWFEVTPESVGKHIADRMLYDTVVDGTCGVGGNAIQFAMRSQRVIGVDLDAQRLRDAAHNAAIYGVEHRMEFVCDDFVNFARNYAGPPIDAVFLSPPWGGPGHLESDHFSLKDVECCDIVALFAAAAALCPRVVLYLPRHQDLHEVAMLAHAHGFAAVEVEKVCFQYPTPHLKLCVMYFTPEVTALTRPVETTKKTVGATAPTEDLGAARQKSRGLPASKSCSGAMCSLLKLPPLVGPLMRALYCRYHYVGKYVIALAAAVEAEGAVGAGGPARRRAAAAPPGNWSGLPPPRGAPHPPRGEGGDAPAARRSRRAGSSETVPQHVGGKGGGGLHAQLLRALGRSFGNGSSDGEEGHQLARCLAHLLGELAVADVVKLIADAESQRDATRCSFEGHDPEFSSCFYIALQRSFPQHYERLLSLQKSRVNSGIASVAELPKM